LTYSFNKANSEEIGADSTDLQSGRLGGSDAAWGIVEQNFVVILKETQDLVVIIISHTVPNHPKEAEQLQAFALAIAETIEYTAP
jgi:hypothetical protein